MSTFTFPLTVNISKDPTGPLGLGVDAANGRVSSIADGSAFATGAGDNIVAFLKDPANNAKLSTVNGGSIPFATARGTSILIGHVQGQAELEFVFVDASDAPHTQVAMVIRRNAPTDPLGLGINHGNGKVLSVAPGAAFLTSLTNPADAGNLILKYKLVSIEATVLNWRPDDGPTSAQELIACVEGKTEFMMVFDIAPEADWAAPQQPAAGVGLGAGAPKRTELTEEEKLPLYERRPELYEPTAPGMQTCTITNAGGCTTIIKDGKGNLLQQRHDGGVVRQEETRCGGVRRLVLTFADGSQQIVETRGMEVVANNTGCPMSYEALDQWEVDSCYGRFLRVKLEAFTIKKERLLNLSGNGPSTKDVWCCKICKMEKHQHPRDGSRPDRPQDAYIPRSHLPCGTPTGTFKKYAVHACPYPLFAKDKHPDTGATLCVVCKYPADEHPEGPDPADAAFEQQGVSDLMWVLSKGRDGTKPIPGKESPKLKQYMTSQFGKTTKSLVAEIEKGNQILERAAAEDAEPSGDGEDGASKPPSSFRRLDAMEMLQTNMNGWLEKYSLGKLGIIKNWKRRHFRLMGGILQYSDAPLPGGMPKNTIALNHLTGTRLVTRCTTKTHPEAKTDRDLVLIFSDNGTERKLLMRAEDAKTHKKWCDQFTLCCSLVDCKDDHPRPL